MTRKAVCCLVSILALAAIPLQAAADAWTAVGPSGGTVNAVACPRFLHRVVYAATQGGGIFKSFDIGASWSQIGEDLPSRFVHDLLVDPFSPSTIYASVGNAGIYRSLNGGADWTFAGNGLPVLPAGCRCGTYATVQWLLADPARRGVFYAGVGSFIFKSVDGVTWTFLPGSIPTTVVHALAVDPAAPDTLYAGTAHGLFKSRDGGASWSPSSQGIGTRPVRAVAVDPLRPRRVYAGTDVGLFRSNSAGRSWQPANTGLTNRRVLEIAPYILGTATLFAGTEGGLFKSVDGAGSWLRVGGGLQGFDLPVRSITIPTVDVLYAATGLPAVPGVGVFKGTGDGEIWTRVSNGLFASVVNALTVTPGSLYAGTEGRGVQRSRDGGASWNPSNTGLADLRVRALASLETQLYAATPAGVFKTHERVGEWHRSSDVATVEALAIDPLTLSTAYAGAPGAIFRTVDSGVWQDVALLPDTRISSLAIAPSEPRTIYAGGLPLNPGTPRPQIFKSTDLGETWSVLPASPTAVATLAVDPNDARVVLAASSLPRRGTLSRSTDGGASWTSVADLESPVLSLIYAPGSSTVVYAGTQSRGVFRSTDGGATWAPWSEGLGDAPVVDFVFDPSEILYAATQGGGVFLRHITP